MNLFRRLKHWHIFGVWILPLTPGIIVVNEIFNGSNEISPMMSAVMKLLIFLMLLSAAMKLAWLYSIGVGLHSRSTVSNPRELRLFAIAFLLPALYFLITYISLYLYTGKIAASMIGVFLLPPTWIAMLAGFFYAVNFVSKSLKAAEVQREVYFDEYRGYFFMTMFPLIGIWFLQPRINRLFHQQG